VCVKLKGRNMHTVVISRTVLTVKEVVRESQGRREEQSHRLSLHDCDAALDIMETLSFLHRFTVSIVRAKGKKIQSLLQF
jgi:hypothetical protein